MANPRLTCGFASAQLCQRYLILVCYTMQYDVWCMIDDRPRSEWGASIVLCSTRRCAINGAYTLCNYTPILIRCALCYLTRTILMTHVISCAFQINPDIAIVRDLNAANTNADTGAVSCTVNKLTGGPHCTHHWSRNSVCSRHHILVGEFKRKLIVVMSLQCLLVFSPHFCTKYHSRNLSRVCSGACWGMDMTRRNARTSFVDLCKSRFDVVLSVIILVQYLALDGHGGAASSVLWVTDWWMISLMTRLIYHRRGERRVLQRSLATVWHVRIITAQLSDHGCRQQFQSWTTLRVDLRVCSQCAIKDNFLVNLSKYWPTSPR
jgi:hypothetical protein